MTEQIIQTRPNVVRGPDGVPICINDLPSTNTVRWTTRNKDVVAAAVCGGLVTIDEATERYRLSAEELQDWMNALSDRPYAGTPLGMVN